MSKPFMLEVSVTTCCNCGEDIVMQTGSDAKYCPYCGNYQHSMTLEERYPGKEEEDEQS